jgi:truncated hemoglobin YjbI
VRTLILIPLTILVLGSLGACRSKPLEKARTGTLAERVGDEKGLETIVDAFLVKLKADERTAAKFATADTAWRSSMLGFLCKTIESECGGEPAMEQIYVGTKFTADEFSAFMEVFIVSMNDADLPQKEQNDLIDGMLAVQNEVVAP